MLLVLTLLLPLLTRAQQDLGNTSAAASGNITADTSLFELKAQFQPVQDDSVLRSGRLGRPLRGEGRGREGSLWSGGADRATAHVALACRRPGRCLGHSLA